MKGQDFICIGPALRFVIVGLLAQILLLAVTAQARAEFMDCTTDEFAQTMVEDPGFVCETIRKIEVQAFGRSVAIRTLRRMGDESDLQYEPLVVAAAETTLAWLDGYSEAHGLKVQDLTFVFIDTSQPETLDALADARAYPDDCVVRLNIVTAASGSAGPVLADFNNTIAHELFHCVQAATWRDQYMQYDKGAVWWVEGTAQYIAHWIFPNPPDLKLRGEAFADAAQVTPPHMADNGGGSVVFFAWLGSGNVFPIFDFIKAMPKAPGPDAQRAALLAHVPPYLIAEFARDYVDGKIMMPDGFAFAPPEPLNTSQVIASTSMAIEVVPLTLFIHDVIFAGGTYMTTGQTNADVNYRHEAKPLDGWSAIGLINTEQDCSSEETLRFAGMAVGTTTEVVTLDAMKFPGCETCAVTDERNACLVGSWLADQGDLSRVIYEMSPATVENVEVTGNFGVKFDPNGTATFGFHKLRVKLNYIDEGLPTAGIDIGGSVDNNWSTDAQRLQMCYVGSKAAIQIVIPESASKNPETGQLEVNPSTSEVIAFADLPMDKSQVYDFACTGVNTMTMTGQADGRGFTLSFIRAQ